ncbi:MAG: response regulator transcription factor [Elusimicrobiota bacterium]
MRYKILLADDDETTRRLMKLQLNRSGYAVVSCESGIEVMQKAALSQPDLLLLDVLLGDADGRELCRRMRAQTQTANIPVILMSGTRRDAADVVDGLRGGADDYVIKHSDPAVLLARIAAVLRRFKTPVEKQDELQFCGLTLNTAERTVRSVDGTVSLTRREFDLLTLLIRKFGRTLSPQYLLETVWGHELEDYNDTHTVVVHISRLKKKLGPAFAARIKNIVGSGYKLS